MKYVYTHLKCSWVAYFSISQKKNENVWVVNGIHCIVWYDTMFIENEKWQVTGERMPSLVKDVTHAKRNSSNIHNNNATEFIFHYYFACRLSPITTCDLFCSLYVCACICAQPTSTANTYLVTSLPLCKHFSFSFESDIGINSAFDGWQFWGCRASTSILWSKSVQRLCLC